jgi:hypothetical protein
MEFGFGSFYAGGLLPFVNYGLFAQTSNSTTITSTIIESSLIGSGLGTLIVPPNNFSIGNSFRGDFGGILSSKNNDQLRIRIKSNAIILADSGFQTLPGNINVNWSLALNFTIRSLGVAGVGSIVTFANFITIKQSNGTSEGFGFNNVNNTTFDTTIANNLEVTAEWSSNSPLNSIYSDFFVLNKIY